MGKKNPLQKSQRLFGYFINKIQEKPIMIETDYKSLKSRHLLGC